MKIKRILIALVVLLFVFGCGKENEKVGIKKPLQENLFKNIDVEQLSKRLEQEIEVKGLKIDGFQDLSSDGMVYYYSTLNGNKEEIITINYENLTATAIVGKIVGKDEMKMEVFKKLSLAIIKTSDLNLTDEESQIIYEELLNKLEKSTSAILLTKNNLSYGIEIISGIEDELVIYVK